MINVVRVIFLNLILKNLSFVLLILIIKIIEVIIRLCVWDKFILFLIIIFKLDEVIILNSRILIFLIIGEGIIWIRVLSFWINESKIVKIVVYKIIYVLYIFVIVIILIFLLYVVLGGFLRKFVVIVVSLFFVKDLWSFGFFVKFFFIILFVIRRCLICFVIVIMVIGVIDKIVESENLGNVNWGSFSYFVFLIIL